MEILVSEFRGTEWEKELKIEEARELMTKGYVDVELVFSPKVLWLIQRGRRVAGK
ncbi:MAG: hypothetical protein GXO68_05655 [Crenarchaeota archaeon]|nr:hypothetical protein [Thermoproteota archaeon]